MLLGCSSDDDSNNENNFSISDNPLSGMLYGKTFAVNVGRADFQKEFGEVVMVKQLI